MTDQPPLTTGRYWRLALACPQCRVVTEVQAYLGVRFTSDDRGGTALRPVLTAKAVEHQCRQLRLIGADGTPTPDSPADPGGVPGQLELAPDGRAPDWAERAAGMGRNNPT